VSRRTNSGHESNIKAFFLLCCWRPVWPAFPDGGVLIPPVIKRNQILGSFAREMEITVQTKRRTDRVFVRQIFPNHTARIEEGKTTFLPCPAAPRVGLCRWGTGRAHSGVFWERKRAGGNLQRAQATIDRYGLMQMGERGAEKQAQRDFSARSFTSRVWHERLDSSTTKPSPWKSQILFCDSVRPTLPGPKCPRILRSTSIAIRPRLGQLPSAGQDYPLGSQRMTPHRCAPTSKAEVNHGKKFVGRL